MKDKGISRHALDRTARGIRVSSPIALDKRRAMLAYDPLQEIEHQFHVWVEGVSGAVAAYTTVTLVFDVDFFDAPEQRDSPLSVPHFTFGGFLEGADVMITAYVAEWNIDTRGAITGADVRLAVCSPGTTVSAAYSGYVHLTFQGYGAVTENDAALDVGV